MAWSSTTSSQTYPRKRRNKENDKIKNKDKVKYNDKGKDWCGLELDHITNLSYFLSNLPSYLQDVLINQLAFYNPLGIGQLELELVDWR